MSRISGGCAEDNTPGRFVVTEDQPEGSAEPPIAVSDSGHVLWFDSGSGPGYTVPVPLPESGE
jgi:hypothetical protein